MAISGWAKFNKICSRTKHFLENVRLLLRKYWICHNRTRRLEQRRTVNSDWHKTIGSQVVFNEIRKINHSSPRHKSSHTSDQTTAYFNIDLMSHPHHILTCHRMIFFYFRTRWTNWKVLRHLRKRFLHSECIYWRYLRVAKGLWQFSNVCKIV